MRLSDIFMNDEQKFAQAAIYQKGADSIQQYLDTIESFNIDNQIAPGTHRLQEYFDAFDNALGRADKRIKDQASSIRDNAAELRNYQQNLRGAADGLLTFSSGLDKAAIKSKLLNVAMKGGNALLSGLGSMFASMAIEWVGSKIIEGVRSLIWEEEALAEAAEEAQSKVSESQNAISERRSTIFGATGDSGIAQEFAELAQGVNAAGENVSLTSDQYARFLEINNQLAELLPTLPHFYDENGNAILDLRGDVDSLTESLRAATEEANLLDGLEILQNGEDVFNNAVFQIEGSRAREKYFESLQESYQDSFKDITEDGAIWNLSSITGQYDTVTIPIELKPGEDPNQVIDDLKRQLSEFDIGSEMFYTDNTISLTIDAADYEKYRENFSFSISRDALTQAHQTEAAVAQQLLAARAEQEEWAAQLGPMIQAALETDPRYNAASEVVQEVISQLGSNQEIIDAAQYKDDYEGWIDAIQTGVIDPITEIASSEAGPALEQLLGLSDNYDIDQSTYLKAVEELRALITAGYEAVGEEVPESLTKLFDSMEEEHVAAYQAYSARLGAAGVDLADLEAANLTTMQQKILGSINTTGEQQLFNSVTTDTQTVEEQLRSYQAAIASASAIDAFDGLKESVDSFTEYQTTVQEALTTGQLTIEQYESLIAIAPEYADALEMQGQQITLNAEKTQELVEARNDEIAADVKAQRSNARVAYIRNSAVLEDLIDKYNKLSSVERQSHDGVALAEQIDNLLAEQTELSNTIDKYALLESQLSEVAQAYKNYEAAMNYASPEDHWEIGYGAVEDLNEGLNSGKMGTAEFQAALDLAIPDDVYKDLETEAEQGQAVADYVSNVLNRFFTEDEVTGMQNFLDQAVELGALEKSFDENGVAEYATKADITWEKFADTMGMTVPMLEAMIGMFDAYDFDGQAFREDLDMAGVNADTKEYLDLLEKQNDLYAERQELVKDSSIDLNGPEITALDEEIAATSEQISERAQGLTVNIEERIELESNIADTEAEISSLKDSLNSVEKGSDEYVEIQSNIAEKQTELDGYIRKLDELGGETTDVEIEVALGVWEQQLAQAKADLDNFLSANKGNYEVSVDGSVTFDDSKLQEEYDNLAANVESLEQQIEVHVSTDTDEAGLDGMNESLEETLSLIEDVSSTGITIKGVTTAVENLAEIASAAENAASEVSGLSREIINLPSDKTTTITTKYVSEYSSVYSGGGAAGGGKGRLQNVNRHQGTARVSGTARAKGTDLFPSNWKLKRPELALTGELGPEMVVRGNEWFLVGEGGAEFNQLKKGDIVFNHQQTEDLLHRGSTFGRGKARLKGTLPEEGLALVTGSFSFRKYQTSNWSGGSGSSGSGSSSSRTEASYNYNGSGGSSGSSDEDDFRETVDWVEKELDRLQWKIDQTAITAESAYKTFSERNKALASEYDQITNKMEENRKGIARYEAEANSVGLSESYAKLVRDGTIDIETITDEDLKDKIDQYTEWYEKALDLRDENAELEETLRDLAAQNFDNLITEYEGVLATIEHKKSVLDTYIDMAELRGQFVSAQYYTALLAQEQNNIKTLTEKRKELNNELNNLVDNKEVEIYSEKWYEFKGEIESTDEALAEANNTLQELSNTIRELEWDRFDYIEERVSRIATEADFLAGLIGDENLFDPDTAAYTDRATTLAGLYGQNYTLYMDQAESYAAEIEKINAELAKDPSNQLLIERKEELVDKQYDSVEAAMDERDAMLSLAEEGYQAQLDILDKLIDKKREARDAERDLYEYQRDVAEQTENIASLQKQLAVYDAQDTEESRKTSQELRTQLEEAQDNLEQTQYDRFVADQDKLFDDLTTEYEDFIDKRLADSDALFADMMNMVNANASVIGDTLRETADRVGVDLSSSISNIWAADNPVSVFNAQFVDASASVISILDAIRQQFVAYAAASDKEAADANSTVNSNNSSIGQGNPKPPSTSGGSESKPSTPSTSKPSIYGTGKVTAPSGLNLRAGASTSTKVLAAYGQGTQVTVLERVNNEWYKVKTADGKTGYMNAAWLSVTKSSGGASGNAIKGTGTITAPSGLNLRASNSTNSKVLAAYGYGTKVSVTEQKGDWYKVKAPDGKEGWMYGDWLKVAKQAAYAKGGVIGDVIRASGEDGMILARSGEAVLTADQLKLLRDTVSVGGELITPLRDVFSVLSSVGRNGGNMTMTIENITLPNVTDPSEFADGLRDALKNDPQTQKAIRAITIDQLAGKNSLSVRKY